MKVKEAGAFQIIKICKVEAMKIVIEITIEQYEKLFSLEEEERENYFRFSMMKPFEKMWNTINVLLKANKPNGYNVIMATKMLGYLDVSKTEIGRAALENLKEIQALQTAHDTLYHCVEFLHANNMNINANEMKFGLYIADPKKLELLKRLLWLWRNSRVYSSFYLPKFL